MPKKISSLPPPGPTALFGLKTLPKNHPPVTRQNIADSCTQPEGAARHQSTPLHQQRNHVSLARMRGLHIRKKPPITPVFITVVQNMHQASQTPAHQHSLCYHTSTNSLQVFFFALKHLFCYRSPTDGHSCEQKEQVNRSENEGGNALATFSVAEMLFLCPPPPPVFKVPSHVVIEGNEKVDQLAEKGRKMSPLCLTVRCMTVARPRIS